MKLNYTLPLFLFLTACGNFELILDTTSPTTTTLPPVIEPKPEEDKYDQVVETEWPLGAKVSGDFIVYEWQKRDDIFLYEKEETADRWHIILDSQVTTDGSKYYYKRQKVMPFFAKWYYKLGPSFTHTVTWKPSADTFLTHYEIHFHGKGCCGYGIDIPKDQLSYTFKHLDPDWAPYSFRVYERIKDAARPYYQQIEIHKEENITATMEVQ